MCLFWLIRAWPDPCFTAAPAQLHLWLLWLVAGHAWAVVLACFSFRESTHMLALLVRPCAALVPRATPSSDASSTMHLCVHHLGSGCVSVHPRAGHLAQAFQPFCIPPSCCWQCQSAFWYVKNQSKYVQAFFLSLARQQGTTAASALNKHDLFNCRESPSCSAAY